MIEKVALSIPIRDERFRLDCACHDAFCFVLFEFFGWPVKHGEIEIPVLEIQFKYHPGSIWKRLKKAWEVIRHNEWHEIADWSLPGYDSIRNLRDFCDRCLAQEEKNHEY